MAATPYDDRDGYIWMDGEFVPWRDTKVHVLTHALHYASAVFEGERAYNGKIFRSLDHSKRLHNSARIMGFDIPFSVEQIEEVKREALAKSGLDSAYVRAIAWRGSEMMGVSAQQNSIHLAVAVWHWGDYFADKMKGIRMTHAQWRRPAPDTAPCHAKASGLYMICTLSKHAAERDGYADALMLDYRGQVAEATGGSPICATRPSRTNKQKRRPAGRLFHVFRIRTAPRAPPRSKERQIEVIERAIMPDELPTFSECFITGSAAEITPVAEIGEYTYKPGQISESLVNDYSALVNGKIEVAL